MLAAFGDQNLIVFTGFYHINPDLLAIVYIHCTLYLDAIASLHLIHHLSQHHFIKI